MPSLAKLVIVGIFEDDSRAVSRNKGLPMRSGTWFGRLWSRLGASVVQDVPPGLEECESCREVNCTQERWLTCARRLAAMAEYEGASYQATPSMAGQSDVMPSIEAADDAQTESAEAETDESSDPRKRVSSSGD